MEPHIQKLPEEYATEIQKKFGEYNRSKETDDILGNKIVDLIFDCVRKYPATISDLQAIFRVQFNKHFGNDFKKTVQNHVDNIILDIRNSDPVRCLETSDRNRHIMRFIAHLWSNEQGFGALFAHRIIADLFQPIACKCKIKWGSGNACFNPSCVDNQVSRQQFDELSLKSEYPIQCGILFLDWFQYTRIGKEVLVLSLYWQKRLRNLWRYFGERTQEMIVVLLKRYNVVEIDVKIELKENYEERIENEKLKHQENIEELKQENETLKNDMEKSKKNEERIKSEHLTEKSEFQKMIQELNQRIEQMNNDTETMKNEQLKSEKETSENVENLMADNDKLTIKCVELKSQLKREGIQIMDFKFKIEELEKTIEKQASNPKNAFKALIKCPNICRIFEKYETILMTDINLLYPTIKSNINKLLQIQPDSVEILTMKVDILNFEKKIEEYLRRVNEDYWKIARNPDISMKELGEEIETIPSDEFMEKYRKLIKENDLKA